MFEINELDPSEPGLEQALGQVLCDCVDGGASVSFMSGLSQAQAAAFWRQQLTSGDGRAILAARDARGIVGVVQVIPAWAPNQPHRAELSKMLVHRRARRSGLGLALLQAAEDRARAMGKTLITLDTVTGGDAERLYARAGFTAAGVIPDYALMPDGALCATTVFYKRL